MTQLVCILMAEENKHYIISWTEFEYWPDTLREQILDKSSKQKTSCKTVKSFFDLPYRVVVPCSLSKYIIHVRGNHWVGYWSFFALSVSWKRIFLYVQVLECCNLKEMCNLIDTSSETNIHGPTDQSVWHIRASRYVKIDYYARNTRI